MNIIILGVRINEYSDTV